MKIRLLTIHTKVQVKMFSVKVSCKNERLLLREHNTKNREVKITVMARSISNSEGIVSFCQV